MRVSVCDFDGWWLNDAVACMKDEWFTLIFIHNADPTKTAEDELKEHFVEMHIVGDWATFGNVI